MGMILPTKCLKIISLPTLWALRRWIAKFLSSPLFRPNTNFLHYRKANLGKIGWDLPGIKRFYSKTEFSNLQYVCFLFEHLYNWFLINKNASAIVSRKVDWPSNLVIGKSTQIVSANINILSFAISSHWGYAGDVWWNISLCTS